LAEPAEIFTRMSETDKRSKPLTETAVCKRARFYDCPSVTVQQILCAVLRLSSGSGIGEHRHRRLCIARQVQRNGVPVRVQARGGSKQSIVIRFLSCSELPDARTPVTSLTAGNRGSRPAQPEEQRFCPIKRHHDPAQHDDQQRERAPDPDDVMPVPVASLSA